MPLQKYNFVPPTGRKDLKKTLAVSDCRMVTRDYKVMQCIEVNGFEQSLSNHVLHLMQILDSWAVHQIL